MKALLASAILAAGLMTSVGVYAKANDTAAPAGTPAGSTGLCNDGSYWTGATKKGACKGHKGIKDWYAGAGVAAAATVPAVAPAAPPAAAPAAATTAPAATPATPAAPAHKSIFSIFNKKPTTPATPAAPAAAPSAATPAPAPAPVPHAAAPVAAGGGAGQVWVNTASNVYHCNGSHWYGKTKAGSYMTEAAAKAAGARPDHGKACS